MSGNAKYPLSIVILGAGRMGTLLGKTFQKAGFTISQVFSRTLKSAETLGKELKTSYTNSPSEILKDQDVYLITTTDDAIAEVFRLLPSDKLMVHTSGATPLSIFEEGENTGVIYPVMSISQKDIDFSNVPICIEYSNAYSESILKQIADSISTKIYHLDSEKRLRLHVAAVFINNYVHYISSIGAKILHQGGISTEILSSLKDYTFKTLSSLDPETLKHTQTGPARRNDVLTIQKHLNFLSLHNPEYKELYQIIASQILQESQW